MKTIEEAYSLIESMNNEAYDLAYDSWKEADDMDEAGEDWDKVEEQREIASEEQQSYFRDEWEYLEEEDQKLIMYYYEKDIAFKEQFDDWFGDTFNDSEL